MGYIQVGYYSRMDLVYMSAYTLIISRLTRPEARVLGSDGRGQAGENISEIATVGGNGRTSSEGFIGYRQWTELCIGLSTMGISDLGRNGSLGHPKTIPFPGLALTAKEPRRTEMPRAELSKIVRRPTPSGRE